MLEEFTMNAPKVFESEYRFCLIMWEHEPINSTKLVKICKERLNWSKATTYTVIRRLSERGVLKNENTIVSSLYSKEQIQEAQMEELVDKTFEGSMPAFIAAFSRSKRLTNREVDQLRKFIDEYQES
jgi:predicted transcriptional regulator